MRLNNRAKGQLGEEYAAEFYANNGFAVIAQNWSTKFGELDLICSNLDNQIIFVEVKLRLNKRKGAAVWAVHKNKQRQIIRTAQAWIKKHPQWQKVRYRFDVLAIDIDNNDNMQPRWYKNAFAQDQ